MIQEIVQVKFVVSVNTGIWMTKNMLDFSTSPEWYKLSNKTAECLEFSKHRFNKDYKKMGRLFVQGKYKHIDSGEILNVVTTHLKSGPNFGHIREEQAN